jgi:hypothetical protein
MMSAQDKKVSKGITGYEHAVLVTDIDYEILSQRRPCNFFL